MLDVIITTRGCCHASYKRPNAACRVTFNNSNAHCLFTSLRDHVCRHIYRTWNRWNMKQNLPWTAYTYGRSSSGGTWSVFCSFSRLATTVCHKGKNTYQGCEYAFFSSLFSSSKYPVKIIRDSSAQMFQWGRITLKHYTSTLLTRHPQRIDIYRLKAHCTCSYNIYILDPTVLFGFSQATYLMMLTSRWLRQITGMIVIGIGIK